MGGDGQMKGAGLRVEGRSGTGNASLMGGWMGGWTNEG